MRTLPALTAALLLACVDDSSREPQGVAADAPLVVLAPAPQLRGRYLCERDSLAALEGVDERLCDAGGDTTFTVRSDTIVSISRFEDLEVADSVSLFDYWNGTLKPLWTARLGGPPTDIARPNGRVDYFEARWERSNGVRDHIKITRDPGKWTQLHWVSFTCRDGSGIGCR